MLCKKQRKTGISMVFCDILHELYIKYEVVTAALAGNDTILTENITQGRKRFITQLNGVIC